MKKIKKYYAVNNQEDEDGINRHSADEIFNKNENNKEDINLHENIENKGSNSAKLQFRNLVRSRSVMAREILEKRMD